MPEYNDDYDPSLYWFPTEGVQRKVSARLQLRYKSTAGKVTERDYDVEAFDRGGDAYLLYGYCRLRNARRTLSTKGALITIDRDTQKKIPDLLAFLEEKYRATPDFPYDQLLDRHGWAVGILLYFASVTGVVREPQRQAISSYILGRHEYNDLDSGKLDTLIRELARYSKTAFHKAERQHATAEPEVLKGVHVAILAVIATFKTPHSEHTRALEYTRKQWKAAIAA